MNPPLVQCPRCRSSLLEGVFNQPQWAPCPGCGAPLQIEIFPALFRPKSTGRDGELVLMDGEATCFYHPNKKALLPCEACGRFVCALCDCELNGQHFCPACLETGKTKGKIKSLEDRRTLYDSMALSLSILPMIFFYFTVITAPMALYVAVRYWNAPRSIVHRTRIRFVLAILIATGQIVGWGILVFIVILGILENHG